ncbi:MAG: hypothetical protein ABFS35_23635 [Bacteroidota bacterium]
MKKIIIYIVIGIIVIFNACNKKNHFDANFKDGLNPKDFKIELRIIYSTPRLIIFENGLAKNIPNGYGENDWIITYKDSVCYRIRHFKTRGKEPHDYSFQFYKEENNIYCQIEISGINNLKRTVLLKPDNCYNWKRKTNS